MLGLTLTSAAIACGGSVSTELGIAPLPDGGHIASGTNCCPISHSPACCMAFGGTKDPKGTCGTVCDGMASPSDPNWQRVNDANGCPYWQRPSHPEHTCGEPNPPPPPPTTPDAGGSCCVPSPHPSCCMDYGGWNGGDGCASACDGMATPDDPGWKLVTDSHGCKVWKEPASPAHKCGEPAAPDSGTAEADGG